MTCIIIADILCQETIQQAAEHLRARGHKVDTTLFGDQVLQLIEAEIPDVLVFSFNLRRMQGYEVWQEIHARFSNTKTQYAWIAQRYANAEAKGAPQINWETKGISAFLDISISPWQLVLSIEQLVYRNVSALPLCVNVDSPTELQGPIE